MTHTTPQELWLWTGVGASGGNRASISTDPSLPSARIVEAAPDPWRPLSSSRARVHTRGSIRRMSRPTASNVPLPGPPSATTCAASSRKPPTPSAPPAAAVPCSTCSTCSTCSACSIGGRESITGSPRLVLVVPARGVLHGLLGRIDRACLRADDVAGPLLLLPVGDRGLDAFVG